MEKEKEVVPDPKFNSVSKAFHWIVFSSRDTIEWSISLSKASLLSQSQASSTSMEVAPGGAGSGGAGAVNFEDLFDFSPEPLEPATNPGASVASPSSIPLVISGGAGAPPSTSSSGASPSPSPSLASTSRHQRNISTSAVPLSEDLLSRSAPVASSTDWGATARALSSALGEDLAGIQEGGDVDDQLQLSQSVGDGAAPAATATTKGRRGRKPGQRNLKTDMKSKLERSRQSARECRARKKLRYQYLDDLILEREKANVALREELLKYQKWCHELDKGRVPDGLR